MAREMIFCRMKKMMAIFLAAVMCLSPVAYGTAVQEEQAVEATSEYQKLHLEEKAELGFVSLEFSSAALTYSVGEAAFLRWLAMGSGFSAW